jgi:hypothetical protein
MKPARSLFSLILLSGALAAQSVNAPPRLVIEFAPLAMNFHVKSLQEPFVGAVILSLNIDQVHYFDGLPPLLVDFAVAGVGLSAPGGIFSCSVAESLLPPGMTIYAQGLTFDGAVFDSTRVKDFVLDVTVPPK